MYLSAMNRNIYAAIDLGTNTFQLLIASVEGQSSGLTVLVMEERPVRLGLGSFVAGMLSEESIIRAKEAIEDFSEQIRSYNVSNDNIRIAGTAAMRRAHNVSDLTRFIESVFDKPVEIISGEKEAELVWKSIRGEIALEEEPVLLMDIGGGSVELIIANASEIFCSRSYPLGASRINEEFERHDPPMAEEYEAIRHHVRHVCAEMLRMAMKYEVSTLIGASGSFDSLRDIASEWLGYGFGNPAVIAQSAYTDIAKRIFGASTAELHQLPGLITHRVDMIHSSLTVLDEIKIQCRITKLILARHSLIEGLVYEMMNGV